MSSYLTAYNLGNLREISSQLKEGSEKIYWLLIQCIKANANNEIFVNTQGWPGPPPVDGELHPYWSIQRYGLEAADLIAKCSQGEPLSQGHLHLANTLNSTYRERILKGCNFRQRRYIEMPSLGEICQAVNKKNTLITQKSAFIPVRTEEADDDYGQVTYYWKWRQITGSRINTIFESSYDLIMMIYEFIHGRKPTILELIEVKEHLKWHVDYSMIEDEHKCMLVHIENKSKLMRERCNDVC